MTKKLVALVTGDGSGPEMMAAACAVAIRAAEKDGMELVFEETPMGWNAYHSWGDTLPARSFLRAVEIGTIFFGGVGDPKLDNTIGAQKPEMKPEARCLLALRSRMGLLLNFRPMIYYKELAHLAKVRPETIPDSGVTQIWIRFLLEDSYFGNQDLIPGLSKETRQLLGLKLKHEVTGNEDQVANIAYFRRETVEKYMRAAFTHARMMKLPLISVDKANVMPHYVFWREIAKRIAKEFPDVEMKIQLVDSCNSLLFTPAELHGVIACGNEHGDILSDGAAAALGSMGLMCSSAINPDTGAAMFESGAGTAPTLAGQDRANPLGRILTAAMMLRHLGAVKGANAIEEAVKKALSLGYRTEDMCPSSLSPKEHLLGTKEMRELILSILSWP